MTTSEETRRELAELFQIVAAVNDAGVERLGRLGAAGRGPSFRRRVPACEEMIENSGLEIVARGETGEVRAVELRGHPFFIGTLFQPERTALKGELHPLVAAFIQAALGQTLLPGMEG